MDVHKARRDQGTVCLDLALRTTRNLPYFDNFTVCYGNVRSTRLRTGTIDNIAAANN
jgi:hypothetical protein